MSTAGRWTWLALAGSVVALAACGSSQQAQTMADAGGSEAGVLDASTVDATQAEAAPPGADASATPDSGGPVDATADAWSGVLVGCAAGSDTVTLIHGDVQVDYDLTAGNATFSYAGTPKIVSFYAGVQLAAYITSRQYTTHACAPSPGGMTITSAGAGLPTMTQTFVADGGNHFTTQLAVTSSGADGDAEAAVSTSWIGPVVVDSSGEVDVGSYDDSRALVVPFDNDDWVTYDAQPVDGTATGYEVAAFYDNTSRNGIVVGSVTHDTWKTGVYYVGQNDKPTALNVFGGASSASGTHDVLPHGMVTGTTVSSPVVFVGYGADWRDLLEEYADANATQTPMLPWSGGVPFGWNSWGKIQTAIDYTKAVAVSDFIDTTLQPAGYSNAGVVYVNLDSYWDNLSSAELGQFAAHCHANGQKAGIYWAPFVDWGLTATRAVEGSTTYTYQQIWLRDGSGNPIEVDGAYAVDPTHPGTKARIDYFVGEFKSWGFDYVKLDFLTHGALESSVRYDPSVQTGIQAFNQGMAYVDQSIGGSMFISESIAPLFPYQYAHSRRVSCDVNGAAVGMGSSEYELNSASYSWWMSGRLYQYNDPDMMVFEGFPPADNMTRLVSAVVSGTVLLDGDDLTEADGQALASTYLTNARINAVAALGKAFRPIDGNTGTGPATALVLADGATTYLAVFNFTGSDATEAIDLTRAGLSATQTYTVTDLWTGATSSATGMLGVDVASDDAKLLTIE